MDIFTNRRLALALSPLALALASCGYASTGETSVASAQGDARVMGPFSVTEHGTFAEPWAAAFAPGTDVLFITEKAGTMRFVDTTNGVTGEVTGIPEVDYGGQGGLGDVAFLASEASEILDRRTIFLSWVEAGEDDTRGAVVGRGTLVCGETGDECAVSGLSVIWRQAPKVTGRGHYSHRLAFSPDGQYLFIASGDRQKMQPAQDPASDLGKIIRIPIDTAGKPTDAAEQYSLGHRNILGLQFDAAGRLWGLEHGPKGGDELNLVRQGANYGWPLVSDGVHYNNDPIPDHATSSAYVASAIGWTPVIAPGDFTFVSSKLFSDWQGDAIIGGLKTQALIRVSFDDEKAVEAARYPMEDEIREVLEGPDGALYALEDGPAGRLLRLAPAS